MFTQANVTNNTNNVQNEQDSEMFSDANIFTPSCSGTTRNIFDVVVLFQRKLTFSLRAETFCDVQELIPQQ